MDKGVNLGNWLVLEKWMSPELFAGTSAEDETTLCRQLDEVVKRERYRVHRDSYVTDRDFAYLARRGIDFVRLPVPYFVFGDVEPFVGCIEYVDRAFDWGERYGIGVMPELHTAPGSQNGFDNGGLCGVCKFHTDSRNVGFVLGVLEQLTARYAGRDGLWGIGVLNEPISPELWSQMDIPSRYPPADPAEAKGSEGVPTDFLKAFYRDAYDRIRSKADDVRVVFHDGFRIHEWPGFLREPDFMNFVVDTHPYLMTVTFTAGEQDLDAYLTHVETEFAPMVRDMAQHFPLMIGEWCVDTAAPSAATLERQARVDYHRRIGDAQLRAWEPATAWAYWSYKLLVDEPKLDPWDMFKSIELGFLPDDLEPPPR